MPQPAGSIMTVRFILDGEEFIALNGGPQFQFSPAISFVVNCDSQEEVDMFWEKFSAGGQEMQCGWVQDKYGVSWQVVPTEFIQMLSTSDKAASQRVLLAMLQMNKLDLPVLRRAYENREV